MKTCLLIVVAFISLAFFAREQSNEIKVVNFKSHYEGLDSLNKLFVVEDNIKIAFWKDKKMYIRSYINLHTDSNTFTLNGERDTTYFYYVFKKNVHRGLRYKTLNDSKPVKYDIDSLLAENGINLGNFNPENYELGKPFETIEKNRNEIIEKYIWNKKKPFDPDSVYRFYDKRFVDIDFSFSPKFDKSHKSKLTKMLIITNVQNKGIDGSVETLRLLRFREMSFTNIDNPKETLKLFQRFEKENR